MPRIGDEATGASRDEHYLLKSCAFGPFALLFAANVAVAAPALALAPAAPAGVEMETKELTNDSTLQWQANREPDLGGYEVLWREATSPLWQHHAQTGNVTRFTVPKVSKDNFLFGVAAVGQNELITCIHPPTLLDLFPSLIRLLAAYRRRVPSLVGKRQRLRCGA